MALWEKRAIVMDVISVCCCSSDSLILSSNSTSWCLTAQRCLTDGVRPATKKTTLFCGKQHKTIFSQDAYPVKPSLSVAVRLATHFETGLWYVRWSLFSITLLTPVAWSCHARAVMVNMRRWGIVDVRLPPQGHSRTTGVTPSPPHHSTSESQSDCINRCFQGKQLTTLRSNRGVHVLCSQVHMCSCVHCYAVFLLCSICIWTKKTLGIGEIVFFSPSYCLFLQRFLKSQRCFKSSVPLRPTC